MPAADAPTVFPVSVPVLCRRSSTTCTRVKAWGGELTAPLSRRGWEDASLQFERKKDAKSAGRYAVGTLRLTKGSGQGGKRESQSPDINIAAMLSTQSNANQSAHAMRVGTALEAAAMRRRCDRHAARGGKIVVVGLPGALSDRRGGGALTILKMCRWAWA